MARRGASVGIPPNVRDTLIFVVGLGGIIALTIDSVATEQAPDPLLVGLFGAMIGIPVFLRVDENRRDDGVSLKKEGE